MSPAKPDISGMGSSAIEMAGKMKLGWNFGNTLEAIGGETNWGNPRITEAHVLQAKQNGFDAIRLPCSWNQYANQTTAKIDDAWLDRVKQVVQYCLSNDMPVVLNIHWDGGWLENNITLEKQAANNAKQKAFWQQIATHLRDFDERLMFASANEPNVENATQMAVLQSYHQTFVDAVRATGGRNAFRVLIVQGPSTDVRKTDELMNTLPTDTVAGRMMVEVHYYDPYNFALMNKDETWGKQSYYWGKDFHSATDLARNSSWGEEDWVDERFASMKTKFADKGIPVIVGEFGAVRRSSLAGESLELNLKGRAHFLKYVTQKANENGCIPFYWDAGNMGNNASALFNRSAGTIYDQQALDALNAGATSSYWESKEDLDTSATVNPDGDWASNLLELYLGSDPHDELSIPPEPTLAVNADARLVFRLHRFAQRSGNLEFQYSTDLIVWRPLAMSQTVDMETVAEFVSEIRFDDGEEIYVRLKVSS